MAILFPSQVNGTIKPTKATMRFILTLVAIIISSEFSGAQQMEVRITGIRDSTGSVVVALFVDERGFLKTPKTSSKGSVENGTATIIFRNLPVGTYAISVFHDRNGNGKLDSNAFGIPVEGIAFGNNAMGMFGPPSFRKASVRIDEGGTLHELRLRYY